MMKKKNPLKTRVDGVFFENFQSIKDPTFIRLRDLTFLFGPNSAGKSAVIDALKFLRKKANGESLRKEYRRWLHREKEGGKSVGNLRLGVSLVIGSDWEKYLDDPPVQNERYKSARQEIIEWIDKLASHSVQVEYEMRDDMGVLEAFKLAIDGVPLFTVGELTPNMCGDFYSDAQDLPDCGEFIGSELTIHDNHWFWKGTDEIKSIRDLLLRSQHEGLRSMAEPAEKFLRFYDVEATPFSRSQFSLGPLLQRILNGDMTGLRVVNADLQSKEDLKELSNRLQTQVSIKDDEGWKLYWRLNAVVERLSLFRELIQSLIGPMTDCPIVSGDREVLGADRTEYLVRRDELQHPTRSLDDLLQIVALAIARDQSKNKAFKDTVDDLLFHSFRGGSEPKKVKALSEWLQMLTKSSEAYRFAVDGYSLALRVGEVDEREWAIDFPDLSNGAVFLKLYVIDSSGRRIELVDVGSGISHVLPVIATLWAVENMLVQQPELHLHPAAQCELGDVFISAVNGGKKAVIETHSEHLLLRILRRVRDTSRGAQLVDSLRISNERLSIYYFEPLDNGATRVKEIRVSREGDFIDRWPRGFFTERATELLS